jgi:TolA-binding protein
MAALIGLGSIVFIAPFTGFLLNLLVMAVSFKFAVDILLSTSAGSFDPKKVSFSDNEYGVVIQIIFIGIIIDFLTNYALLTNNNTLAIFFVYSLQFIMPAIYMVLAYSGSMLEALNPVTLIRFIKPWFFTYVIFSAFYLFTIYLQAEGIFALIMNVVSFQVMYVITAFMVIFFMFLNFHIMGFLINQNFNETDDYEEQNSTNSNSSETYTKESNSGSNSNMSTNPIYARIQNLIETKTTDEALAIINELQKDGDNSAEIEGYKRQVLMIAEEKVELPIGDQIHGLIVQNKIGTAFKLLEELYANKNTYLETSETDLGILAHHAFSAKKFQLVVKILNGFIKKYPNSDEVVPNYFLIAQVLYKNPKSKTKALSILNGLVKKYPNHAKIPELKSWAKGIELMQNKSNA